MQNELKKSRIYALSLSCLIQSSAALCVLGAAEAQVTSPFERTLSGSAGSWQFFPLEIPAGTTSLDVQLTGGTGDADLYVRPGEQPTEQEYACRPWTDGNEETCDTPSPQAGTWYLAVNGFNDFSDVTIRAVWASPTDNPEPPAPADWQKQVLDQHNLHRAKHCVATLTWDDELARSAQAWADGCVFSHEGVRGTGMGENLSAGTTQTGIEAVDGWYSEIKDYDFASPGFAQGTGHFTQVVWQNTTKVGCGVAQCPGDAFGFGPQFPNAVMYVCRYTAQGNMAGEFEANVFPVCE